MSDTKPLLVVLDANVLFPWSLRDTLLRVAEEHLYEPRISKQIIDEGSPRCGATSAHEKGGATSGHEKGGVRYRIGGAGAQEGSGSVWCYESVDEGDLRRVEH